MLLKKLLGALILGILVVASSGTFISLQSQFAFSNTWSPGSAISPSGNFLFVLTAPSTGNYADTVLIYRVNNGSLSLVSNYTLSYGTSASRAVVRGADASDNAFYFLFLNGADLYMKSLGFNGTTVTDLGEFFIDLLGAGISSNGIFNQESDLLAMANLKYVNGYLLFGAQAPAVSISLNATTLTPVAYNLVAGAGACVTFAATPTGDAVYCVNSFIAASTRVFYATRDNSTGAIGTFLLTNISSCTATQMKVTPDSRYLILTCNGGTPTRVLSIDPSTRRPSVFANVSAVSQGFSIEVPSDVNDLYVSHINSTYVIQQFDFSSGIASAQTTISEFSYGNGAAFLSSLPNAGSAMFGTFGLFSTPLGTSLISITTTGTGSTNAFQITSVYRDGATLPATITVPSSVGATFTLSVTLPEGASSQQVTLVVTGPTNTNFTIRTLNIGANSIPFNSLSPTSTVGYIVAPSTTLTQGTGYSFMVQYQDQHQNPVARSNVVTGVTVDYQTLAPTLAINNLLNSATKGPTLDMQFTFPETQLAGSVRFVLTNSSGSSFTFNVTGAAALTCCNSANSVSLNFVSLAASSSVMSLIGSSETRIPDGTYNATLTYQDNPGGLYSNAPASSAVIVVTLDTATALPSLASPVASTSVSSQLNVTFTLPDTPAAGSVVLTFTNASAATTTLVLSTSASGVTSFILNLLSLAASPSVASASASTLDEGVYTVAISYQDVLNNTAQTASAASVRVDRSTLAPIMVGPTPGTQVNATTSQPRLDVNITFPEAPTRSTVTFSFISSTFNCSVGSTFAFSGNAPYTWSGALTLKNLAISSLAINATGCPNAIPDGTYTVQVSYQDNVLNAPAASSTATLFLDTTTASATLVRPLAGSVLSSPINLTYTLGEEASTVSVAWLNASNPSNVVTLTMGLATSVSTSLNTANLGAAAQVSSTTASVLADGVYNVRLTYQDVYSNTAFSVTNNNVTVDTTTRTPTLTQPASGVYSTLTPGSSPGLIPVTYNLPEAASTVTVRFASGVNTYTLTMDSTGRASGTTTFTFDPKNVQVQAPISATSAASFVDGTYTVTVLYQDLLNNGVAFANTTGVVIDRTSTAATLFLPTANQVVANPFSVMYLLPSNATEVEVFVSSVSRNVTLAMRGNALIVGTNITVLVYRDRASTVGNNVDVNSFTPQNETLTDGNYSVIVRCKDQYGNPFASTAAVNVIFDSGTVPPELNVTTTSTTVKTFPISYFLPEAPFSGSVELRANSSVVVALGDSTNCSFTWTPSSASASAGSPCTSASLPALSDRSGLGASYTLQVSYRDSLNNSAASSNSVTLTLDYTTATPTLTKPTARAYRSLEVQFTLPETPLADTVALVLTGVTRNLTLTLAVTNTSPFNFSWDMSQDPLIAVPTAVLTRSPNTAWSAMPEEQFQVVLQYRDQYNNPVAQSAGVSVTVDLQTLPPTLFSPANSVSTRGPLDVIFRLGEAPRTATDITLTFTNASGSVSSIAAVNALNFAVTYPANFTVQIGTSVTTGISTVVPDGNYTVTISYTDALGNAASSASALGVVIDTVTRAPTLSAPVNNARLRNPIAIAYTLPEVPATNSVQLQFTNASSTLVLVLNMTSAQQSVSFSLTTTNVLADTSVVSASRSTLPDGTYTVALSYTDQLGNSGGAASVTNVLIDTVTLTPTLSQPVAGNYRAFSVVFTLPEPALSDTAQLTFVRTGGSGDVTLTLTNVTQGTNTIGITPATQGLVDGTYSITVSYQDVLGNSAAVASQSGIVIDTVTQVPVLSVPGNNSEQARVMNVSYTLPETPLAGSVRLVFTSSSFTLALVMSSATSVSFSWNPAQAITSVVPQVNSSDPSSGLLPDGTYTVTLSYQDQLGNPQASAVSINVLLATSSSPPTLLAPSPYSTYSSAVYIRYLVASAPSAGSIKLVFENMRTASTIELTLSNNFGSTVSLSWDPTKTPLAGGIVSCDLASGILCVPSISPAGSTLPNGRYYVTLSYQDRFGNPRTSSVTNDVFVRSDGVPFERVSMSLQLVFTTINNLDSFAQSVIRDLAYALGIPVSQIRLNPTSISASSFGGTVVMFDILPPVNDDQKSTDAILADLRAQLADLSSALRAQTNYTNRIISDSVSNSPVCLNQFQNVVACPTTTSSSDNKRIIRIVLGSIAAGIVLLGICCGICIHYTADREKKKKKPAEVPLGVVNITDNARFEDADTNRDGFIDPQEFAAYKAHLQASSTQHLDNESAPAPGTQAVLENTGEQGEGSP